MKDLTNRPKMFCKKDFLTKIQQYLQENICVGVSFLNKFAEACKFIKKDTPT